MLKSTKSPGSWKKIIKIYEQSNLEKSDFCKKHKLAASQVLTAGRDFSREHYIGKIKSIWFTVNEYLFGGW